MNAPLTLALASLRSRRAAALATFLAVTLGGALLVACGGVLETAVRLDAAPQRLAGAPIVVGGSAGFRLPDEESEVVPYPERSVLPADAAARIAAVPGVARAVPDASFAAAVVGGAPPQAGTTAGHAWASAALTPYALREGDEPVAGQVVLDEGTARAAGARPGDIVDLVVAGEPGRYVLSGVAAADRATGPALFFAAEDADRLTPRPGTVDLVGVLPVPGADVAELAGRIQDELGPAVSVRTGDERGGVEFVGVDAAQLPLILLGATFGGMVLVVMGMVVAGTVTLTVRQRHRELALLRASGATPRQVHRMVVAETAAVATAAAVLAAAAGGLLAELLFALGAAGGVVPPALSLRLGPLPYAAAVLLCLLIPIGAAAVSARAAASVPPVRALTEAAIPTGRPTRLQLRLAAVFAVGTLALAGTTMAMDPGTATATGGPAVLTGAIAVALVAPALLARTAARLADRFTGPVGGLAAVNARARAVALSAVLVPVTLATAVVLSSVYTQTSRADAITAAFVDHLRADVVVAAPDGVPPALARAVREVPGAHAVSALATSRGWIEQPYDGQGSDPVQLLGVDADTSDVLDMPVVAGSLRDLRGAATALPRVVAERLEIGVGDRIALRLGDGTALTTSVVAILDGPARYPSLVLPSELLAEHTSAGLPALLLVRAADGRPTDDLLATVTERVQAWPGAAAGDRDLLSAAASAGADVEAWINYLLAALAVGYAAIASVNALAVALLARRREFGLQRLIGASRPQVRRMLLVETALVAGLGLWLGAVIAICSVWPTAIAMGQVLPSGPLWVPVAVVATVAVIVWPTTVLAARTAMRPAPFAAASATGT